MAEIAILGAGIAGFGAAYHLDSKGVSSTTYEQKPYYGGHTASFKYKNSFIFDEGPHISFTKIERMQKILADNVDQEYEIIQAKVNNYWQGCWVKHPAQVNLRGLPEDLVITILKEITEAHYQEPSEIKTFEDWLKACYGNTFAENFPMRYGYKYHTLTADKMSVDWIGPRLYKPDLEEVFKGAVSSVTPDVHYISHFRYPSNNGFVDYLRPLPNATNLRLGHKLKKIDMTERLLSFENGQQAGFDSVVSSIPLPDLIPLVEGAPEDVVSAAKKLSCSQCVVVNLVIDRVDISDHHWTYFYDLDFCFSRLNFPHMLSPHNVPEGTGSIQAEIYFSDKYRPLTQAAEEWIPTVIKDLKRCGLLYEEDNILFQNAMFIPYGNVIFDLERAEALSIVHGFLDDIGIHYCGRYGEWKYIWTDESFISGETAASKALSLVK